MAHDLELELFEARVTSHHRLAVVVAVARERPQRPWPRLGALFLQEILDITIQLITSSLVRQQPSSKPGPIAGTV